MNPYTYKGSAIPEAEDKSETTMNVSENKVKNNNNVLHVLRNPLLSEG